MIDATFLNLVGVAEFGITTPAIRFYQVVGSTKAHLMADRSPGNWDFKMIPIKNGRREAARWMPRHLVVL